MTKTKAQISFAVTVKLCFRYADSTIFYFLNPKFQAVIFCACTARFVSDLFRNHIVEWFSHDAAQIIPVN